MVQATDERGQTVTLQSIADSRSAPGMFGSGYYEMLARQITADLQSIRATIGPGERATLFSKGISFGTLSRRKDGSWDTSQVEGLPLESLATSGAQQPPSLLIFPFHQAAAAVSLRVFTVNAFNQHMGMQATERFGIGTDPDGDGVVNELTRADITACTLFQATLAVPGRVMAAEPEIRTAARKGEVLFEQTGCTSCHIPALPLDKNGWIYTEPNPYNPAGNLQAGGAPAYAADLSSDELPQPRLKPKDGVVMVPLYTDFKLHDICNGSKDPNREPLNQHDAAGSSPNYFHHGQFTTIRKAILNHFGEADSTRRAFLSLSPYDQGTIIEFLKSLQVLPAGTRELSVTSTNY